MNNWHLAHKLQREGKPEEAIEIYQKAIAHGPDLAWYHYGLANILKTQGKLKDALKEYDLAIKLNPSFEWFYFEKGELLGKLHQYSEAITNINKAIEINPKVARFYNLLGQIFSQKEQIEEAIKYYLEAIHLDPANWYFCWNLATAYLQKKENGKAINFYTEAINLYPQLSSEEFDHLFLENTYSYLPEIYELFGIAQKRLGNLEQALASYAKGWEIKPLAKFRHQMGIIYEELGLWSKAIQCYEETIQLQPSSAEVNFCLGVLYRKQNNVTSAINYYKRALEITQKPNYYCELALALAETENWSEAFSYCLMAWQMTSNAPLVFETLASICQKLGDLFAVEECQAQHLPVKILEKFGLCNTAIDWPVVSLKEVENTVNLVPIDDATDFSFQSPRTIEETIHPTLMVEKLKSAETFVAYIPSGTVWFHKLGFVVIDGKNQVLSELTHRDKYPEIFQYSPYKPALQQIDGTVAVILGFQNYFTWMMQILPCLELLRLSGVTIDQIDKIALWTSFNTYQKQTLDILGIPEKKVISIPQNPYIQAKNLIVPSSIVKSELRSPQWACQFLKKTFGPINVDQKNKQRLYISRSKAPVRKVLNELEVLTFLQKYDFTSVVLEELPIQEQANLLANAEVIISPHGAGLVNIVFCQPGTKILEIFSPIYVIRTYWVISNLCNLDYYYMIGEEQFDDPQASKWLKSPHDQQCRFKNIWVNIKKLESLMKIAELL